MTQYKFHEKGLEMLDKYHIRTDLALEAKERFESDNVEIQGVILEESYNKELEVKTIVVRVTTEKGAKTMGKPVGTYITIEVPNLIDPDEGYHQEISSLLSQEIKKLLPKKEPLSILVVGLGNRNITPDALGPQVIENLHITRHIINEYGRYAMDDEKIHVISALIPGVMAQTGMESLEIIKGVISETAPDCIIAVDALAARSTKRLSRTIQIADTGIHPGSGVGNHRRGLNYDTLGIPVIGIGVPTVVDAATIVNDTMENFILAMESSEALKGVGEILHSYNATEKYELIRELISPHLNGMFVTPKNVDETIKRISFTVSESINML